ncbi:MAG: efflux RND transporter permease subunit [Elusimicrobiota bacterium]|jgi:HAE1 family hydrophobic/amphiphilic exporter-1|nr:efflux RND transporter permease subunit [Elusimicrobiota bacterium]
MNLAKLAVKRPTFIMSLVIILVVLGALSFRKMSVKMMPDMEVPFIVAMTVYPGAGAADIEQNLSKPIEDALSAISGIEHITSNSMDNTSVVMCEFDLSKNPDIAAQECRDKIASILHDLPSGIEAPMIIKINVNSPPLISVALKSNMNQKEIYDFADTVIANELSQVSGVSEVNIIGGAQREIHIDVDKEKLKDYKLSLVAIAEKIASNSLNVPAGKIDRGAQQMSYRTIGEFENINGINNVVLNFTGSDIGILVRDIAQVVDSQKEQTSKGRLTTRRDGKVISESAAIIEVFKQSKGNEVAIADDIIKKIKELNARYANSPQEIELSIVIDSSKSIRANLSDVRDTMLIGVLLVIMVVYFFLGNWRSTFITALALPNSMIGAFIFMNLCGFSVNVLSLMSLSLAIGLLIDDAIVVRENIFRHYKEGKSPQKAAIAGTKEVSFAVIATTAAVIAVFAPVSFLGGLMGIFLREFGLTVCFAVLISLFDALTIAPLLSAYMFPKKEIFSTSNKGGIFKRLCKIGRALTVDWVDKVFSMTANFYKRIITAITKSHFWRAMTIIIVALICAAAIFGASKNLKVSFMPQTDNGEFNISAKGRAGTSLNQLDQYSQTIENILMQDERIKTITSKIGGAGYFSEESDTTLFHVVLAPLKERKTAVFEIQSELREKLNNAFTNGEVEIAVFPTDFSTSEDEANKTFALEIFGNDLNLLYEVSQTLIERYKEIPYLADIGASYSMGNPETKIVMNKLKMEKLGVNSVEAGYEIRAMIEGIAASKYRENGNEYDIRVQFRQDQKDIIKDFDSIYIYNTNQQPIRLSRVASPVQSFAPTAINRKDKKRIISVEGNVAYNGNSNDIEEEAIRIFNEEKAKPQNAQKWQDITLEVGGLSERMQDVFLNFIIAAALSLLVMYLVLASLYESIIIPFVIMSALPLAIIGAISSLIIFNQPLDIFTMIGMIMLLGIVAKNSILLVDYTQQQIRLGLSISDALIKAGLIRLKPILMTSFALIGGMLPLAFALTQTGGSRQGMGIVVIGGMICSTILTLLIVPAIYGYMDALRCFLRRIMRRPKERMIDFSEEEIEEKLSAD